MRLDPDTEDLLRRCAPQVLGALVRRHGGFARCEDAVQEALLAAATSWPRHGLPDEPVAWLVSVAGRRLTDEWRSDAARRSREEAVIGPSAAPPADVEALSGSGDPAADDTLELLLLCTHPSLSEPSRIALTLRAVGGLTTAEIARAFLVPETTMAQRISRAKATISAAGASFSLPGNDPADRDARTGEDGSLVTLAEQDRGRWDRATIAEATALLEHALATAPLGPYQLQAAIAAVHAEAASDDETDWAQIVVLYGLLDRRSDNPVVTLNRAVAVGMADGPRAGLAVLDSVADDPRLRRSHRPDAVRAHLLERLGDRPGARDHYRRAARAALNQAEQRYLEGRAARLESGTGRRIVG
ncbi:RNA polymerase sigma factor [Actinomycetospora endophytica]|uniref:RNA polymerase sigma factor n=1 Tax=Actinomycetospora endophytica TaxID=2291215 RepID=A0ABS8PBS6_9PSEU|nr:sigma factor-like helix-turn-helix DNA-binding protein [Actinomycetospora endophytica]MCD2195735.1 RNA polymerase sigma factor [Actinomycetospora endophytica]